MKPVLGESVLRRGSMIQSQARWGYERFQVCAELRDDHGRPKGGGNTETTKLERRRKRDGAIKGAKGILDMGRRTVLQESSRTCMKIVYLARLVKALS